MIASETVIGSSSRCSSLVFRSQRSLSFNLTAEPAFTKATELHKINLYYSDAHYVYIIIPRRKPIHISSLFTHTHTRDQRVFNSFTVRTVKRTAQRHEHDVPFAKHRPGKNCSCPGPRVFKNLIFNVLFSWKLLFALKLYAKFKANFL